MAADGTWAYARLSRSQSGGHALSSRPQLDLSGWDAELGGPLRRAPIVGYLRALRAHWLLASLIVVAALAGSAAWLAQRSPTYVATSSLLVTPVAEFDTTLGDLPLFHAAGGDPERPVKTAATVIGSQQVADRASALLGGSPRPGAVADAVEVRAADGENLVEIEASSSDGALAARIANAFARATLEVRGELLRPLVAEAIVETTRELGALPPGSIERIAELRSRLADLRTIEDGRDPSLSIAERATTPSTPEEDPEWLVLALALAAGIAVAAAISILIELLVPGPISDEDELRSTVSVPVLARLPRISGRQARLLAGDRPAGAIEGFRTLRGQLEFRARTDDRAARSNGGPGLRGVIAIASPSPEDGRTNVALGLARAALATGARTLVLEANVHSPSIAAGLAIEPDRDLTSLIGGGDELSRVATPVPAIAGLDVVVAPRVDNLRTAEWLSMDIPDILAQARQFADCVIVDTPPLGFASDVLPVLSVADRVVLVVRLRHTRRGDLISAVELLAQHGVAVTGLVVVGSPVVEAGEWRQDQGVTRDLAASRLPTSG